MRNPFSVALGLVLLSAAAAGFVGPLYAESAESCGSLLLSEASQFCDPYEQRRWIVLAVLTACALPPMLFGLRRTGPVAARLHPRNAFAGAAAGLLTLPVAVVLLTPLFVLNQALYGFTQAFTGVPYILAPAVIAVGALVAARLAVRAGADAGCALAAAAVGLPLLLSVQAVAEAFRWRLDDTATPLLLSGAFSYNQPDDAATLVTLALSSVPMCLALGVATRARRQMPSNLGAGLLGLAALVGSLLFEATDDGGVYSAASIRWLPLVLLPAGLAVLAICTRSSLDAAASDAALVER